MARCTPILFVLVLLPRIASGWSLYTDYCATRGDGAELPADPRSFATKENGFSSVWMSCHAKGPHPATCGEWRASVAEGKRLLEEEAMVGAAATAKEFNALWVAWGDSVRPPQEEFEARLRERYGFQPAPFPNPYPVADEDPATTGGGSGQLPMGFIQIKDEKGVYNGKIAGTCLLCHAGRIGEQSVVGLGNTTFDFSLFG
ncbi:MAG: hypothetical protein ACREQY_07795, partial [Candidatus Binatia bacterium]